MGWLETLGLMALTVSSEGENVSTRHEPVLEWRMDVVPELENSTSIQYSGVAKHDDLLYLGTSNKSGVLLVDARYSVKAGRLPTQAPVQATPTVLKNEDGTTDIFVVDLSGEVYRWQVLERPTDVLLTKEGWQSKSPTFDRPNSDRSKEHTLLWSVQLDIPVNTPIETDGQFLYVSTNNDVVYALDMDGNIGWRFAHRVSPTRKGNLQLFGAGRPLVQEDRIVVGFSDGAVLQLAKSTGEVLEKTYNGEGRYPDVIAQPTVVQGGVLVSGFEQPSYKGSEDSILWSKNFGSVQHAVVDPFEGNQTMVYHAGSDGLLRKIDTTSGAVLWEWDSKTGAALTAPTLFGESLLVASHVGGLYLIDRNGQEHWRSRLDYRQTGYMQAPLVSDCTIHTLSAKGFLEQYDTCD